MPAFLRYNTKTVVTIAVIATLLVAVHLTSLSPLPRWEDSPQQPESPVEKIDEVAGELDENAPPCRRLAGAEDIVVVMRTGATEIKDKLPIHLNTTFKCYPDTLIFSDYAEVFEGHQVYDALADVDQTLKETNPDFQHYQRLQHLGREGLADEELHGESYESGPIGKNDNPGWRLDKWKFLPMIVRSLELRPRAKWYIFVEPDTYVVWSNMLQWLQTLDASKPLYLGSEVQIGEDIFAHGGSAFVMSQLAMKKGAKLYGVDPDEWHTRTSQHWAGDCILGTELKRAGVELTWSWPMFQGGNPIEMNWNEIKGKTRLWCVPALSYHHFTAPEVESMWVWEQQHIVATAQRQTGQYFWQQRNAILHHSDMFKLYVMPNISSVRSDWSNMSPELVPNSVVLDLDQCRRICEANEQCLQYELGPDGCSIANEVQMGESSPGFTSGWMTDRVKAWTDKMDECAGHTGWTVPK